MKRYIGTKFVKAESMKLGDFIETRKRNPYENDPKPHPVDEAGYLVVYEDGYESWSPARVFEKTYRSMPSSGLTFGETIIALKAGFAVRRQGWNGRGLFVIKQVPAHIDSDVIPKMQSLPQSAKDLILKGKGFIDYTNQCLIYNEDTGRADSWVPSISDVFAEDWEIR